MADQPPPHSPRARLAGSRPVQLPVLHCTLGPEELAQRARNWEAAARRGSVRREAGAGRAVLRYHGPPDLEAELRRLVGLESQCCGFLAFDVARDGDDIVLTVSGPNIEQFLQTQTVRDP